MNRYLLVLVLFVTACVSPAQKVNTTLTYSVKPPSLKSEKPPVLILLHGYGSNEEDLFAFGSRLDSRMLTFSLRAPLPKDAGYCWFPIQFLAGGNVNYSYKEAAESRNKILSFISNACKAYGADSTHVYILGFSQGAIMAFELALYAPSKICGVMALSGRMMAETEKLKHSVSQLQRVKFFVGHGKKDDVVNFEGSQKAVEFLKAKKVFSVTFKTYNMAHTISPQELEDVRAWLQKSLD